MRPTERARIAQANAPDLSRTSFTKRELMLTTRDERFKMAPAAQVHFDYSKWILEMEMNNAHLRDPRQPSFDSAAAQAFADRKAGIPDPEKPDPDAPAGTPDVGLAHALPWPRRRRRPGYAPA